MGIRVERLPPSSLVTVGWHALDRVRRRKNRIDTLQLTNSNCIAPRRNACEQKERSLGNYNPIASDIMKVCVIYGSESGTAERGIRAIAKGWKESKGIEVSSIMEGADSARGRA